MAQERYSILYQFFKHFSRGLERKLKKSITKFCLSSLLHFVIFCEKKIQKKDLTNVVGCDIIGECTKHDPLAQSVEHLTFNQGVRGSSLRWVTKIREGIALAMPSLILTICYVTLNPAKSQDFAKRAHSDLEQQFPSAHAGVQSLRWGLG